MLVFFVNLEAICVNSLPGEQIVHDYIRQSSEITNPVHNALSHAQPSPLLSSLIFAPVIYIFSFFLAGLNLTSQTATLSEFRLECEELVFINQFYSILSVIHPRSCVCACNPSLPTRHVPTACK